MTLWIDCASDEMPDIAWNVVEEAAWLSKKPTSRRRIDLKYCILMRDVCRSAVLVKHAPPAN